VAAIQAMAQANADYYGAIGDSNRAQFRLYRALGQPAECLATELSLIPSTPADPYASSPATGSSEETRPPDASPVQPDGE